MKPPLLVPSARIIKDEYARFAQNEDDHAMSGRPDKRTTHELNDATIRYAKLNESLSILDVGCGDGYLLERLGGGTGVTLTEEEANKLRAKYPMLKLIVGDFRTITSHERYDRIIVNSTFHLLGKKAHLIQGLANLYRLALPDALLWIGDHPSTKDAQRLRSPLKAIKYVYRHYGVAAALRYSKHIWVRRHRAGNIVVNTPTYPCTPETTISLARMCGFELIKMWDAREIAATSPDRYFYLFKRVD